jgi:uncharacterized protein (DUF952 family)
MRPGPFCVLAPACGLGGRKLGSAPVAMIFHITRRAAWTAAQTSGRYEADSLTTEGFIHLSDRGQVLRTASTRFAGQTDLVLLCVAVDRLEAELRYEVGDPGSAERFPHLYGALNLDAVMSAPQFTEGTDGFSLPTTIPAP